MNERNKMKRKSWPVIFLAVGLPLMMAATAVSLPANYWQHPSATLPAIPHDWSSLERELKPEACAQCHAEQFSAWQNSRHAQAFSPGLIGQFPGMSHTARNACLNCHAPLSEQKYRNDPEAMHSLALKLKQPDGFDDKGDMDAVQMPLRHAGVTCAACHVREWQRFGPPQRSTGAVGQIKTPAHGGFTASKDFERSTLCASCHQFPQAYAINGKPMENTIEEWKQSKFSGQGIQCQNCHMPDRRHAFKGIHDPAMVKKGLLLETSRLPDGAALTITSKWIGHAFPTYVTPKVIIRGEEVDSADKILRTRAWEIIREVHYNNGWKEIRDTRLLPGETRQYRIETLQQNTARVRFIVQVIPDHFYKGVYRRLLNNKNQNSDARKLIGRALTEADSNDYMLYSEVVEVHQ